MYKTEIAVHCSYFSSLIHVLPAKGEIIKLLIWDHSPSYQMVIVKYFYILLANSLYLKSWSSRIREFDFLFLDKINVNDRTDAAVDIMQPGYKYKENFKFDIEKGSIQKKNIYLKMDTRSSLLKITVFLGV